MRKTNCFIRDKRHGLSDKLLNKEPPDTVNLLMCMTYISGYDGNVIVFTSQRILILVKFSGFSLNVQENVSNL